MNKKQLYQEIGDIDEDLVEDALLDSERQEIEDISVISEKQNKSTIQSNLKYWSKWTGLVACMLVLIVIVTERGGFQMGSDSSSSEGIESVEDAATTAEGAQSDQAESTESEWDESAQESESEDSQMSDSLVFVEVTQSAQVESLLDHPIVNYELTEQEVEMIVPSLNESYGVAGSIYLYALENDDHMMKEVQVLVTDEVLDIEAVITIAYDALPELYTYPEDTQKAEIEGVEVMAGYVVQSTESGGERIYVADFEYDYVAYHVEMCTLDYDIAEEMLNQLVQELLVGEVADLSSVVAGYVQTGE